MTPWPLPWCGGDVWDHSLEPPLHASVVLHIHPATDIFLWTTFQCRVIKLLAWCQDECIICQKWNHATYKTSTEAKACRTMVCQMIWYIIHKIHIYDMCAPSRLLTMSLLDTELPGESGGSSGTLSSSTEDILNQDLKIKCNVWNLFWFIKDFFLFYLFFQK